MSRHRHTESLLHDGTALRIAFPRTRRIGYRIRPVLSTCQRLAIRQYTASSRFEAGTDYRASMPQFRPESFDKNRELLWLIHHLAEEKNATPAQISLAWMLCKKAWIVPIPGTRKFNRLQENAGASDIDLTADEVKQIDKALDTMHMSAVFGGTAIKS